MLIVALVLAVIALAALVTAVVTANEVVAWVCIAASSLGVVLLIADAIRERKNRRIDALSAGAATTAVVAASTPVFDEDRSDDLDGVDTLESVDDLEEWEDIEDHPEEVVHDEPEYDTYSDDEAEFPEPAEEAAVHTVIGESDDELSGQADDTIVVYETGVDDSDLVESDLVESDVVESEAVESDVVESGPIATDDASIVVYESDSPTAIVYAAEPESEPEDEQRDSEPTVLTGEER